MVVVICITLKGESNEGGGGGKVLVRSSFTAFYQALAAVIFIVESGKSFVCDVDG